MKKLLLSLTVLFLISGTCFAGPVIHRGGAVIYPGQSLEIGEDDGKADIDIHDAGTITIRDDSDDTSVVLGPVTDGTTVLGVTGSIDLSGNIQAATYGSGANPIPDATLLGIDDGTTDQILVGGGGNTKPEWGTDLPTAVTIGTKYIYRADGTDVPVADGGTGASTLTDGGVLLGSGTGAITVMPVLTDGQIIVGDGTTDPVAESGDTARISLGVGSTDSPTFVTTDLTNVTDNNLPKMGASGFADSAISDDGSGNVAVQSGTDSTTGFQVLDADGGTPVLNVDTDGEKVGIGTAAPQCSFHVLADIRSSWLNSETDYGFIGSANGLYGVAIWANGGTGEAFFGNIYNNSIGDLNFVTKAAVDANNIKLKIEADGNVGINTTSPQSLLDVQGAAGAAGIITAATKETTVVATDELGRINFNAPLEADGTDAILPGASIWAVAEDTFAADNNKTSLVFATGSSEAAVEKAKIDSNGMFHFEAGQTVKKTNVSDTAYGTSALTSDYIVSFTSLTASRAAVISSEDVASGTATQPRIMIFKDESGSAGTYPITISLENAGTINGNATKTINTPYGSATIYLNGTNGFTINN